MALLKAFVLQVVLFGLYKLFLEQVVEQHLVPDELKRNILVGLIGLLCFGIQLYTDKTEDENAAADEIPKSISAEISVIYEAPVSVGKSETSLKEISTEKKMPSKVPQAETISEVRYSSTFADFSTNASGSVPIIDMTVVMGEPEIPASTLTSCIQETTTTSVLNGFSETIAHEESDDEAIEIDQFVAREQFKTIKTEPVQTEDVADESNGLGTTETDQVELINAEDVTEEAEHESEIKETPETRNVAEESCKVVGEKDVTKTSVESKYLSINGEDTSKDLGQIRTLNIDGWTEAEVANGVLEESLNINNVSSNMIESKEPVSEEKINEQEMTLSPELEESVKEVKEIKTSAGETNKTSSTAEEKDIETLNENCRETSTLGKTMSSPSNKLTVVSTIEKITATEEAWVAPLLIDISFIYACH